ncbi:hypothetical protein BDQ12DRAFT_698836 [Crucibulum laeve]|uniref:Uncharacterized protein n=1 Tax=Crucibulum laeve TaxID=68775 RepID=A0A5C3MAU6_9AGAR|nr:hypothetical protein BDQ12DRAFT_698836 [Crucibulum laeve]
MSQNTSESGSDDSQCEVVPPFHSLPNSYGIYCIYPSGQPTYTPDELFQINHICDSENFAADSNTNHSRAWWSSFSSSIKKPTLDYFAPFKSPSVFRLMDWFYSGSTKKSLGELDRLVKFKKEDLTSFCASHEAVRLDDLADSSSKSHGNSAFTAKDGWIEQSLTISLPVIKAVLQETAAETFTFSPYKTYWKPDPNRPPDSFAAHHLAYIPKLVDNFQDAYCEKFGVPASAEVLKHCRREIIQAVWLILLDDDFMDAYIHGFIIKCCDEILHRFFPQFFTYSADYPEKILLVCIKYLAKCLCPQCLMEINQVPNLGMRLDCKIRETKLQIDNQDQQERVEKAQKLIYEEGARLNGFEVEFQLSKNSLTATQVRPHGFNFHNMFVPDLLHEFELGIWKATFTHLLRILHATGGDGVQKLNKRFRQISTFGNDTIQRFTTNVAAMKKLAARDFEDLLQCYAARGRRKAAMASRAQTVSKSRDKSATKGTRHRATSPKKWLQNIRKFNLKTYKLHSLGDYVKFIRMFGTADGTSTQTGELEHRRGKSFFVRVHKGKSYFKRGISKQERREHILKNMRECAPQHEDSWKRKLQNATEKTQEQMAATTPRVPFNEAEDLPFTAALDHHHIAADVCHKLELPHWLGENKDDPALKDFLPQLKEHLFGRVLEPFTPQEQNSLHIVGNCIYKHKVMHTNFMTLSWEEDSKFPYWFGCVLGIFHAMVQFTGSGHQTFEPQRLEFLYVRWYGRDVRHRGGWKSKCLHHIGFVDGSDSYAFGFLDPEHVICGIHLIPAFSHGCTVDILPPSTTARTESEGDKDWQYFYVGQFVDWDMLMRFRGGGVGHHSTRSATNYFYNDWDPLDIQNADVQEVDLDGNPLEEYSDRDEHQSSSASDADSDGDGNGYDLTMEECVSEEERVESDGQEDWDDNDDDDKEDFGFAAL